MLPHYCAFIPYSIAFVMIVGMSYLIVLYGIKFDGNPNIQSENVFGSVSMDWLMGSGGAVMNSFGINPPIKYVAKTIIVYFCTTLISKILLHI